MSDTQKIRMEFPDEDGWVILDEPLDFDARKQYICPNCCRLQWHRKIVGVVPGTDLGWCCVVCDM